MWEFQAENRTLCYRSGPLIPMVEGWEYYPRNKPFFMILEQQTNIYCTAETFFII